MGEQFRVLIADDEQIMTMLQGKLLELEGYATKQVNESTEVIRHVREFRPHAVLVDIAMAGLTGYEVAKQIRAEPGFEKVLIVAISGYGDSHARMSLQMGLDHHLVKPVDFKKLCRILAGELEKQGVREDHHAIASRLAEVNSQIERILKSPEDRKPGEFGALIHERNQLERRLTPE